MTTSRPASTRLSKVRFLLGLTAVGLLALLPVLHHHAPDADGSPSGPAGKPCSLCAIFSSIEAPAIGGPSIPPPVVEPVRAAASILPLEQAHLSGIASRAPPSFAV